MLHILGRGHIRTLRVHGDHNRLVTMRWGSGCETGHRIRVTDCRVFGATSFLLLRRLYPNSDKQICPRTITCLQLLPKGRVHPNPRTGRPSCLQHLSDPNHNLRIEEKQDKTQGAPNIHRALPQTAVYATGDAIPKNTGNTNTGRGKFLYRGYLPGESFAGGNFATAYLKCTPMRRSETERFAYQMATESKK